jgi:hypothetical protein
MIWSTSVQFGPSTSLIIKALKGIDLNTASDLDIITIVQKYKHDKTEILFRSSPTLWDGLKNRALKEKEKLLILQKNKTIVDLSE